MSGKVPIKSSWADEVEDDGPVTLPPPSTVYENDFKITTEYSVDDNGKKIKNVRTFKIEKRSVPKCIATRKAWAKFGDAASDGPGPNPATTVIAEDVFMQFLSSKEEDNKMDEDALDKLKSMGEKGIVKCRSCNGEHWTSKCPYKDSVLGSIPEDKSTANPSAGGGMPDSNKPQGSKYVPPSMREGGNRRGDAIQSLYRDDSTTIRISNLSESTTDGDLEELVKPFGQTSKIYLAKERNTNLCKGFAYVHYKSRSDASRAILKLNGHGYDHLILSVDWSKPSGQGN